LWQRDGSDRTWSGSGAHGAHLVADPHPEQNFFARSDNYVLAKKGCGGSNRCKLRTAPGLPPAIDDLATSISAHQRAIGSLIRPSNGW